MSKQHEKLTISNRLRRGLAGILSLALLLGLLPAAVVPAAAAEHWAVPYVQTLTEWGVMRGDISGNMAPERSITRAEFVTMMNRAYGYTRTAGHPFTDVKTRDWYNEDIDIAYNMGYFQGTSPTTASPNSPLTREQAAVLLARNMMLQPTVGETLGFSDTRTLSEWSRGLVGAATQNGIISGYNDGSFKPQANITRGEVAAMLVRAIGTPIQEEGDHTLGNVYGNVTVNTSGVKLRDGVITGNLYLTGGIDLGDVLMENITVLGEIIVSGAGESDSAQSSIVLRNVTANSMSVDSISDQFVTIRAEGNTDIKTTTVRTNAYVDDSTLPGYGLWKIIQDGGSLLQLAGNVKEVVNQTPNSELQIVQGTANKVTIDEKATGSSVLVDGDARVDELDLDVATDVTGEGDIKNLNVGAAGSTVEQLPDNIVIRPGITTDINGSEMNSSQAAEASAEPRLLAGYPRAKNIAPTSATLVFSVNKPGTIYWAISAVADGSVSEADLIENPVYGGKIVQSGTINATAADTEYTANVTGLTQDGSYYISAILVDGRDRRSPVKVSAFSTPDGTRPAFSSGPTATLRSTKIAQVTGTPNKSCRLYWALLPEGATPPTAAQFKANAVTGNVGYGSMDVVKNVSQTINVNRGNLKEKTNYVAYLWLTDHDGAQSSQVYSVPIYIPDETPPVVSAVRQTNNSANSADVSFTMNETGRLYWAVVTDEMHDRKTFINYSDYLTDERPSPSTATTNAYLDFDGNDAAELAAKISVTTGTGAGALVSGTTNVTSAEAAMRAVIQRLNRDEYNTSIFYMYYVGEDAEGNLSEHIGVKEINIRDEDPPILEEQRFDTYNPSDLEHPLATTSIQLIFSESIRSGPGTDREHRFWDLYQAVDTLVQSGADETEPELIAARAALARELYDCIKLYQGEEIVDVPSDMYPGDGENPKGPADNPNAILNYRYATVSRENGTGRMIISFPHEVQVLRNGVRTTVNSANLASGATYHFTVYNVHDCAAPTANPMRADSDCMKDHVVDEFRVAFAQVSLKNNGLLPGIIYNAKNGESDYFKAVNDPTGVAKYGNLIFPTNLSEEWKNNPPQRMDGWFTVTPVDAAALTDDTDSRYDILFWADRDVTVSLYSRDIPTGTEDQQDQATWQFMGTATFSGTAQQAADPNGNGYVYQSLTRDFLKQNRYNLLHDIDFGAADTGKEYALHVDTLLYHGGVNGESAIWNDTVHFRISLVAGSSSALSALDTGRQGYETYTSALRDPQLSSLGVPDYAQSEQIFNPSVAPEIIDVGIVNDDTDPKLTVTLKDPGFVNYLIIKLENLRYLPDGSVDQTPIPVPTTQKITDSMITDGYIKSYATVGASVYKTGTTRPDLKEVPSLSEPYILNYTVETPIPSAVVGNPYPNTVQQGYTSYTGGYSEQPIPLTESLEANTVYLLCLVPQGAADDIASRSDQTYCFRFVTEALEAPKLWLRDQGDLSVEVEVNRFSNVSAVLMVERNLTNTFLNEPLNGESATLGFNNLTSNLPAGVPARYLDKSYTVAMALEEDYPDGSDRSVFDVLASNDLKQTVLGIAENGRGGSIPSFAILKPWSGQVPYPQQGNSGGVRNTDFDRTNVAEDATYLCIAVAYIPQNEASRDLNTRSFRALPGLQPVREDGPLISGIAWPDYTEDENGKGELSGKLVITFDTNIYLMSPGNKIIPMAHIGGSSGGAITGTVEGSVYRTENGTDLKDYRPLGLSMSMPSGCTIIEDPAVGNYMPRSYIEFEVQKSGNSVSIALPELYTPWNQRTPAQTLTLTYNNGWTLTSSNRGSFTTPDFSY